MVDVLELFPLRPMLGEFLRKSIQPPTAALSLGSCLNLLDLFNINYDFMISAQSMLVVVRFELGFNLRF